MSNPFKELSRQELLEQTKAIEAELVRRKEEQEQLEHEAMRVVASAMTLEFVNAVSPKHSRTSCSDEHRSNGFYHLPPEDPHPTCWVGDEWRWF